MNCVGFIAHLNSQIISDVHEWMNEIPTVPGCSLANPQPRERAWADRQGKKTLLNFTVVTRDCEGATEVRSKWETSVAVQHHYSDRTFLLTSKENERTMTRKRAARPVSSRGRSDDAARLRRHGHSRNGRFTGGYICQRITQASQVRLIANGNLVQNIQAKAWSIEIFSVNNDCESTAYNPFMLKLLQPHPLVRAASRDRVVGPRRGGAHCRAQRREVFEKLLWE